MSSASTAGTVKKSKVAAVQNADRSFDLDIFGDDKPQQVLLSTEVAMLSLSIE